MKTYDSWQSSNPYQRFMGRWSTLVADEFLNWLPSSSRMCWLDVGCGTGALSELILNTQNPVEIIGVDSSPKFIRYASSLQRDPRVRFEFALADALPGESGYFDRTVSGLVLNFISQPGTAIAEMKRVTRPGGIVAIYVWDYAEGMQMLRYFWDTVVEMDPGARELDEGVRFPLCHPEPLRDLFQERGLEDVDIQMIDVQTVFSDFDDYWGPFLGAVGPAPGYVAQLDETDRKSLEERLSKTLPMSEDGSIPLHARAWSVRGIV